MENVITLMWQAGPCVGGNCPALYKTDGGYILQGKILDSRTLARLDHLGDDESAVFVPADIIDRIREDG